VQSGRALHAGISAYSPEETAEAAAILTDLGTPLLIHQPAYSMLERSVEDGLLDTLDDVGAGCIVFSPLAQGLLTDRYLDGIPAGSRATHSRFLSAADITDELRARLRALSGLAADRGQTLAQLALAWVLRDPRVTSALVGASSVAQLEDNVAALRNLRFADEELARIDDALAARV
jgi:L-glyceraldehyde 3-phosphate reductase